MVTRRGFLGALIAAPAIVRAESLMKIIVPNKDIILLNDKYLQEFQISIVANDGPVTLEEWGRYNALGNDDRRSRGQLIVTDSIMIDTRLSSALIRRRLEEHQKFMSQSFNRRYLS